MYPLFGAEADRRPARTRWGVEILQQAGYGKVANLAGGMLRGAQRATSWRAAAHRERRFSRSSVQRLVGSIDPRENDPLRRPLVHVHAGYRWRCSQPFKPPNLIEKVGCTHPSAIFISGPARTQIARAVDEKLHVMLGARGC